MISTISVIERQLNRSYAVVHGTPACASSCHTGLLDRLLVNVKRRMSTTS
jgi:hypothetical protein